MARVSYIPIDDCENRGLYDLRSRTLDRGLYDARTKQFIGIRTKNGLKFLDSEFHWDAEKGTACPLKFLGYLDPDIRFGMQDGFYDEVTGKMVSLDKTVKEGIWYYTGTGHPDRRIRPIGRPNKALLAWLKYFDMKQTPVRTSIRPVDTNIHERHFSQMDLLGLGCPI